MPAAVLDSIASELDAATIVAAQAGDRGARRLLVLRYQDRVFHLLRRMLGPSGVASDAIEDLAQEVFMRAFAALARFDVHGAARMSTWLLTIAARRAIDALREASRRPRA
ncbi:MAG TPA: sigma-70 family RNA polymerase sigma factor, partial [Nannocystaceae bacterium]|nr:sigma-70 family RNA polymerase sigma factor [Nannocystaceae bacterium]